MYSIQKICSMFTIMAAFITLSGCATSSTFTAYPHKIRPIINSISNRTPIDISQYLLYDRKSADSILYNMESGRYAQFVGNTKVSISDFNASINKIRENEEKALISASDIGSNIAATFLNDNAVPYEGEGYERVLLHHYQAINYLKINDLEGAGVEVRRANAEQNEALKRFETELEKSGKEASMKNLNSSRISTLNYQYAQMDELAGKVKNSFQNAYTFYLSAFIYELLGQFNDAYIDYKKALEIYPDNSYLQKDVLRLANNLGMREEYEELKQRFNPAVPLFEASDDIDTGELLVIFEDGFVPEKHEIKIPLPAGRGGIISIAFPIYQEKWSKQLPLQILQQNDFIGKTEPICDVRGLAVKALQEKVPLMVVRQVARAITKAVTAAETGKRGGDLAQLAAIIWNIVSESADLRSWLTLPSNVQILRATLPIGSYQMTLQHEMADGSTYANINITHKGKVLLLVNRAGRELYTSVTQL